MDSIVSSSYQYQTTNQPQQQPALSRIRRPGPEDSHDHRYTYNNNTNGDQLNKATNRSKNMMSQSNIVVEQQPLVRKRDAISSGAVVLLTNNQSRTGDFPYYETSSNNTIHKNNNNSIYFSSDSTNYSTPRHTAGVGQNGVPSSFPPSRQLPPGNRQYPSPAPLILDAGHSSSSLASKRNRNYHQQQMHHPQPFPPPQSRHQVVSGGEQTTNHFHHPVYYTNSSPSIISTTISKQQHHRMMRAAQSPPSQSQLPPSFAMPSAAAAAGGAVAAAADIAKEAPMAGFLYKLGANIPEYKRRFFLLQPGTYLYYFLSPTDTTPRGCLDLDGSWIEEIVDLPTNNSNNMKQEEGRYRFAIVWENGCRVVLEARTKEMATSWIKAIQQERLPYYKMELSKAQRKLSGMSSRIKELEQMLNQYKFIEKDRDGALEDAIQWKSQFYQLDESVRRLTQQIRKPVLTEPPLSTSASSSPVKSPDHEINNKDPDSIPPGGSDDAVISVTSTTALVKDVENKQKPMISDETNLSNDERIVEAVSLDDPSLPRGSDTITDDLVVAVTPSRDNSLLDEAIEIEQELDSGLVMMEVSQVPGVHFSGLHNACEQIRASLKLASEEAATALEDLKLANAKADTLEKKMGKAEKHICKLWEENVSLRKAFKQKKREKRVLVREVRNLMSAAAEKRANKDDAVSMLMLMQQPPVDDCSSINGGASDNEERLIDELEEHVLSSIRLHEQFVAATSPSAKLRRLAVSDEADAIVAAAAAISSKRRSPVGVASTLSLDSKDGPRTLLSLFDDESDSESIENVDAVKNILIESAEASLSSSVEVQLSETEPGEANLNPTKNPMDASPDSASSTPERKNPVELLDEDEESQSDLGMVASQSESSKSVITSTGQATAKLACPLADVVNTKGTNTVLLENPSDMQVYHLTFYSQKIGLQFQKVPPPPVRAKGLLTEAMTTDLVRDPTAVDTAYSELRRIAAFSSVTSEPHPSDSNTSCPVAEPLDAVLVCGFVGFDDSGTNVRPRLGARLVAFDGVSVEVGRWTFESIRKSIQARGRPLTLSFRNDFLTTEQRRLLTKATKDVEKASRAPAGQPTVEYGHHQSIHLRRPSIDPSVQSALSSETEQVIMDGLRTPVPHDDEYSSSAGGSDYRHYGMPHSFSSARSLSSSAVGNTFYSFSEAGSSTSVLSAVVPLVHSLLSKRSKEPFTPDYLRREPQSVEQTPQHQDFKSELL